MDYILYLSWVSQFNIFLKQIEISSFVVRKDGAAKAFKLAESAQLEV